MKIIEALKELKLIEKRIQGNQEQITKYASYISIDTPPLETESKQRAEVDSLIQANYDLILRYLELKQKIELTNLKVKVTLGGKDWTISQLISLRRGMGKFYISTLQALSPIVANKKFQELRQVEITNPPKAVLLWDEAKKNEQLKYWQQEVLDRIDPTLEIVNATTDLVEDI